MISCDPSDVIKDSADPGNTTWIEGLTWDGR
jgi:hypothetical protein